MNFDGRPKFCYPRMTQGRGAHQWEIIRKLSIVEAGSLALVGPAEWSYYPLARRRQEREGLVEIRFNILKTAEEMGFPNPVRAGGKGRFDRIAANQLYSMMNILPADAASPDVWTFMNMMVFPDITMWRYGQWSESIDSWTLAPDRMFALNRSVFGRLWWRAHIFGPEIASNLGEDEIVQILERPRLGGNPELARILGRSLLDTALTSPSIPRMNLLRDVMKRLGRKMAVVSAHSLSPAELRDFVEETFRESLLAARVMPSDLSPIISSSFEENRITNGAVNG